jgi:hypothetical protein
VRVGRVFGALAGLVGAVVVSLIALQTQHFACDFGVRNTCSIESFALVRGDSRFPASALRGVRVDSVWKGKGKGTEYGVVVLTIPDGELRLIDAKPKEARDIAERVQSAMSLRSEVRATLKGPRLGLLFGAVFAWMGISLGWTALRRMGAIRLALESNGSLRVERRVFGVPISARSFPLLGVTDVALEWSDEADFWRSKGVDPRRVGRIALVTRGGALPLTPEYWPGETLHYRAAAALRRNLGFSPGELERRLHALENTLVRPALARTHGGLFALVWIAVGCGSLIGLAVLGLTLFALGFMRPSDGIEPWMLVVGCGGGAVTGVALVLYIARLQPPR